MSAGLVLAEIRALGRIVTLRPDGKLSIKPAIPDGEADRIPAAFDNPVWPTSMLTFGPPSWV
jgi:hypothetical protein